MTIVKLVVTTIENRFVHLSQNTFLSLIPDRIAFEVAMQFCLTFDRLKVILTNDLWLGVTLVWMETLLI